LSLYVIDASVAAKWFLPEQLSEAAIPLRKKEHELYVPGFFFLEMHNLLLKRIRRKEISNHTADLIRKDLRQHPFLIHSDRTLQDIAYPIAHKSGCSFYDGLYLALAIHLGSKMVTADRRLYNGLAHGPFLKNILWVEDLPKA
jgi:predicted nucleic acid-binding protein